MTPAVPASSKRALAGWASAQHPEPHNIHICVRAPLRYKQRIASQRSRIECTCPSTTKAKCCDRVAAERSEVRVSGACMQPWNATARGNKLGVQCERPATTNAIFATHALVTHTSVEAKESCASSRSRIDHAVDAVVRHAIRNKAQRILVHLRHSTC